MDDETAARIAALERHIDQLYALLGRQGPYSSPSWTPPPSAPQAPIMAGISASESVMQFVRTGQEIHAIKQYRTETGCGLKEAKQAVDAIVRDYRSGRIR